MVFIRADKIHPIGKFNVSNPGTTIQYGDLGTGADLPPVDPPHYILRETSAYLLREDGGRFTRES